VGCRRRKSAGKTCKTPKGNRGPERLAIWGKLGGELIPVRAASIFHFGTFTVGDMKRFLAGEKIPVRL
jgi:hypothetical protein